MMAGSTGVSIGSKAWFYLSHYLSGPVTACLSRREERYTAVSLDRHRYSLADEAGIDRKRLAIPVQVHQANVEVATTGGMHADTDGLITTDPSVVLTLQVADCVPLFLYDPSSRIRGLIHIGWRGAAAGVVPAAVQALRDAGARMDRVEAVMGPHIQKTCYEVGDEVAAKFSSLHSQATKEGHALLDLAGIIRRQLIQGGLMRHRIFVEKICSHCDIRCHSFRRDSTRAGRMIAFFSEGSFT